MKDNHSLCKSARYIKGVGPKKIKILNSLGIQTVKGLLYHFPFRYEDRGRLKAISNLTPGQYQSLKAEVLAMGVRKARSGRGIFEMAVGDKTGKLFTVWFNQPYMKNYFKVGDKLFLYGKVEKRKRLEIINPECELIPGDDKGVTIHTDRMVPIYPLTRGIGQRTLRGIIFAAVEEFASSADEFLPPALRRKHKLLHITASLKNIHFPENRALLSEARRRLIFEEFFNFQLVMTLRKKAAKDKKGISFKAEEKLAVRFRESLPFKLTASQERVMDEVENDMKSSRPMRRLLQGDVGSGKTVVALHALLKAVENGYQGVFMAPTEILAQQHYISVKRMLKGLRVKVVLLAGGMKARDKDKAKKKIGRQKAGIIIGTHSLIQKTVNFNKLGLAVIDEQHKFGVAQRETLVKKGLCPDVLIMTATPIPRSLAYTIYGDLDLSVIDKLPPGRKAVTTWWVSGKKRDGAYEFIRKQIANGRQAYIVYPLVEESEALDLRAAKIMHKKLKERVYPDLNVGLLYGKMKAAEKKEIMQKFKSGQIDILVSTIVIEVGIDVANAAVMLIEHAERFGLSQLHQLRGRIGRGKFESYCILISSSGKDEAKRRLSIMSAHSDGFKIAEEDLKMRGPGEFFGTRQHGYPELRVGNILKDTALLNLARREVLNIMDNDPGLKLPANRRLFEGYAARYF